MINDPNKHDAARNYILRAGYTDAQADRGIAYAEQAGAIEPHNVAGIAICRILYTDEQIAEGVAFEIKPEDLL